MYLVFLFVLESNLFSPILRPSEVPGVVVDTVAEGSPLRFTDGAARTVSWAQSLHGLDETSFFIDVEEDDLEGPTVGVVVADRLETVAVLEDDIVGRS